MQVITSDGILQFRKDKEGKNVFVWQKIYVLYSSSNVKLYEWPQFSALYTIKGCFNRAAIIRRVLLFRQ